MRYHIRIILKAFVARLICKDFCGQLLGFYMMRKVIEVNGRRRLLLKRDTLHSDLLYLVLDSRLVRLHLVDAAFLFWFIFLHYDNFAQAHQFVRETALVRNVLLIIQRFLYPNFDWRENAF